MCNKQCSLCSAFAGAGCCVCLFLFGIVLLPLGAVQLNEATSANPAEDFQALGIVCNITGVQHCWSTGSRTEKEKKEPLRTIDTCTDTYSYFFMVNDGSFELLYTYESKEEYHERDNSRSCSLAGSDSDDGCWNSGWQTDVSGAAAYRSYTPGQTYACWAPTAGNNRDNLPSLYNCGEGASPAGDACVKLWDPQTEADAAADSWTGLLGVGVFLLLLATGLGVCGAISFCCYRQASRTEADQRRMHAPAAVQMAPTVAVPPPAQPMGLVNAAQPVGFGAQPMAQAMPVGYGAQPMAQAMPVGYGAQPVGYGAQAMAVGYGAQPMAQAMAVAQAQPVQAQPMAVAEGKPI